MKTRLLSLQFALFFKDVVERPDTAFSELNDAMLNLFDGIPSVIPVPRELPPEIPVVSLRSESEGYQCNIARSRIDIIFTRSDDQKQNMDVLRDFNLKVAAFAKYVCSRQSVVRFGVIARYFHDDKDAVATLNRKYFGKVLGNVTELSLRYNAQTEFMGKTINDLVEIGANQMLYNGELFDGLLIQRDINNVPVSDRDLSFVDLQSISSKYAGMLAEAKIEELIG
jgi:hypothetical protein